MSDKITLVEAIATIVDYYDAYRRELGMPLLKAFANADAIKILFDSSEDTCTLEAYYKEELTGSFTSQFYDFTDYLSAIFQNVEAEHSNVSLEEALDECLSDYGIDGFMDLLTTNAVEIEVDNETVITFKFEDEFDTMSSGDDISIIIPVEPDSISRSNISTIFSKC